MQTNSSTVGCEDDARNFGATKVDYGLLLLYAASAFTCLVALFCAVKLMRQTKVDTLRMIVVMLLSGGVMLSAFANPAVLLIRLFGVRRTSVCALAQSVVWLGWTVTGLTLALINIDGLLMFTWGHRYLVPAKKIVSIAFAVICAASVCIVALLWISGSVRITDACILAISPKRIYLFYTFIVMVSILPIFVSFLVANGTLCLAYRRRRTADKYDILARTILKLDGMLFVFLLSLWTMDYSSCLRDFAAKAPLLVWFTHAQYPGSSAQCSQPISWALWTLHLMPHVYPIGLPMIVCLGYAPYRKEFKRLVCSACCE